MTTGGQQWWDEGTPGAAGWRTATLGRRQRGPPAQEQGAPDETDVGEHGCRDSRGPWAVSRSWSSSLERPCSLLEGQAAPHSNRRSSARCCPDIHPFSHSFLEQTGLSLLGRTAETGPTSCW